MCWSMFVHHHELPWSKLSWRIDDAWFLVVMALSCQYLCNCVANDNLLSAKWMWMHPNDTAMNSKVLEPKENHCSPSSSYFSDMWVANKYFESKEKHSSSPSSSSSSSSSCSDMWVVQSLRLLTDCLCSVTDEKWPQSLLPALALFKPTPKHHQAQPFLIPSPSFFIFPISLYSGPLLHPTAGPSL